MEEVQRIVRRLGVNDLRTVLQAFQKSTGGRRPSLQMRVIRLVRCNVTNNRNVNICDMLRNIHMQNANSCNRVDSTTEQRCLRKPSLLRNSTANSGSGVQCDIVEIPRTPVHPDVRFRPLPFYDVLDELVKPTALKKYEHYSDPNSFIFHLTPAQVSGIKKGYRERRRHTVQVQIRLGLLETTSLQDDNFPPGLTVKMNGSDCEAIQYPNPRPVPINATHFVKLDPTAANKVDVSYIPVFQTFVVAVYLVRHRSWNHLLSKLKAKGPRVALYTQGMIQQKLQVDLDNEIATTHLRVHLVCPLGKMRLINPCRALTCDHVQCFDASTYLQLNEKASKWVCPVCNKAALFEDLVIDEYFLKVLTSDNLPYGCTEIQLMSDGGWQPMGVTYNAPPPTNNPAKMKSLSISSSEDECEVLEERAPAPVRQPKSPVFEMVDLISSPSPDASPSTSNDLNPLPPKKRKTNHVVESEPDIIDLSSGTDGEDTGSISSSSSTTSLSHSDSDSSTTRVLRRRKQNFDFVRKLPTRFSTRNMQIRTPSPEQKEPIDQQPEYDINREKSSPTTLVLRKRFTSDTNEGPVGLDLTVKEDTKFEKNQIVDGIIDTIIDKAMEQEKKIFTSSDSEPSDKEEEGFVDIALKALESRMTLPKTLSVTFRPAILQRAKPSPPEPPKSTTTVTVVKTKSTTTATAVQTKSTITATAVKTKSTTTVTVVQPKLKTMSKLQPVEKVSRRKNLSQVVSYLNPVRDMQYSELIPTNDLMTSPLTSFFPPPPDFSAFDMLHHDVSISNSYVPQNQAFGPHHIERDNIVSNAVGLNNSSYSSGFSDNSYQMQDRIWLPFNLSPPPADTIIFTPPSPAIPVLPPPMPEPPRPEVPSLRLPAILRKSREKK